MIHIEGMGWFGAITALALERAEINFTWSDIDTPVQAWQASTGMVYPCGDERSEYNRQRWQAWTFQGWLPEGTAKLCRYVFAHKKPPHEGRYEYGPWWGHDRLQVAAAIGVCVDPRSIVLEARSRFADRRVEGEWGAGPLIIAHGHARAKGFVWGWSRKVALRFPEVGNSVSDQTAFYGKRHRFDLTYAYPIPDEPGWWWAGSSLVNQRAPKPHTADDLENRWHNWLDSSKVLFDVFDVVKTQPIVQGWRPKPVPGDPGELVFDERAGGDPALVYPALWHSGVRWAPALVERAVAWAASFR